MGRGEKCMFDMCGEGSAEEDLKGGDSGDGSCR